MMSENTRSTGRGALILLALCMVAAAVQGCAALAGAAAGGAVGYYAGREGGEDEVQGEDPFE